MGSVKLPDKMNDPVDYVTLQIDGRELNVSEIARNLKTYYSSLRDRVSEKFPLSEQVDA